MSRAQFGFLRSARTGKKEDKRSHSHLLVRLDPDLVKGWAAEEAVQRWSRPFPPRDKSRRPLPISNAWVEWHLQDAHPVMYSRDRTGCAITPSNTGIDRPRVCTSESLTNIYVTTEPSRLTKSIAPASGVSLEFLTKPLGVDVKPVKHWECGGLKTIHTTALSGCGKGQPCRSLA
jgi:hypothetical protein